MPSYSGLFKKDNKNYPYLSQKAIKILLLARINFDYRLIKKSPLSFIKFDY